MSQANLCRLCINACSDFKRLYDDQAVYEITIKYFDPEFLMKKNLPRICLKCWCQIIEFHSFKHTVLLAQTKLADDEFVCEQVIVKSESSDRPADTYVVSAIREEAERMSRTETPARTRIRSDASHPSLQEPTIIVPIQSECSTVAHEVRDINPSAHSSTRNSSTQERLPNFIVETTPATPVETAQFLDEPPAVATVKNESENIFGGELELIDVASDSQPSSDDDNDNDDDDDMPLLQPSSSRRKSQTAENENSKDYGSDEESDGAQRDLADSPQPRKSAHELDEIIAQWRPILECLICCRPCSTFSILENHYRQQHPSAEFFILCCQMKFNNRRYIEEHIRLHNDPGIFKCKVCGKNNTTRRNLKSHMTYWHSETNRDKLLCTECGKMSKTPGALRRHKQRHNAKREIKCSFCGQEYMDRKAYFEHLRTHQKPNYHYCSDCPKGFKHRAGLRVHRQKEHSKLSQPVGGPI